MAVYQDNEARVALNAPNTACTGRWGVCGIFKHFSGFEFPLLPNRIHACPLRLRHLPQIRLLKFGRDEGDGDRIWRRKGCGFEFFLLQNRVHIHSSATACHIVPERSEWEGKFANANCWAFELQI